MLDDKIGQGDPIYITQLADPFYPMFIHRMSETI